MQWVPCIKIPLFLIIRIVSVYFGCILIDTESLQEKCNLVHMGYLLYTKHCAIHQGDHVA